MLHDETRSNMNVHTIIVLYLLHIQVWSIASHRGTSHKHSSRVVAFFVFYLKKIVFFFSSSSLLFIAYYYFVCCEHYKFIILGTKCSLWRVSLYGDDRHRNILILHTVLHLATLTLWNAFRSHINKRTKKFFFCFFSSSRKWNLTLFI